jgi:hypothetical protein
MKCHLADARPRPLVSADAPAANPQNALNTIGSVVQAAGSLASAQAALNSAGAAAGTGDLLQTVGSAAQAFQVNPQSQSFNP